MPRREPRNGDVEEWTFEGRYHVGIVPKCRREVFYGRLQRQIGVILRDLRRQRGLELLEGHSMGCFGPFGRDLCQGVTFEMVTF